MDDFVPASPEGVTSPAAAGEATSRWQLIRDVAVFQMKLALDALRDFALSPISLVAAVADLVTGGEKPGKHFYAVLGAGRETERWIRLFGELDRVSPAPDRGEAATIDAIVERVERVIVEQYERGGVTASAKDAIDRGLDAIGRKAG
jgi:hypothetical protein